MREPSPSALLQRIRDNDERLISEIQTVIERITNRWDWTTREDPRDIAQDCFVKLISSLERGRFKGQSSFKTYLYAVVRNTCIDYYRAEQMAAACDIDKVNVVDAVGWPDQHLISVEERRIACRVLLSLPRECRRLWRAVFFGKRTYRQAAEILGLTEGTVKRKMWECRQRARRMVEKLNNREPKP